MKKFLVKLSASENKIHLIFDLDDLGVTESEWNRLSNSEKNGLMEKAAYGLPEQPYWRLDSYSEKK